VAAEPTVERSLEAPRADQGPARVLFVGGIGRSGSTLLERMLGELPGTVSLGEVVHLWKRGLQENQRCSCGERFHGCAFWAEIGERAFGGWSNVDAARMAGLAARVDDVKYTPRMLVGRGPRAFAADLNEYVEHYRRIYDAARDLSGAEVVIDSSKHTSLAYCLRHAEGVDLRLLHLVRDARGVAYSWTKKVRRPEIVDSETYMPVFSPARLAVLWNGHNVLLELLRLRKTPTMLLRYEDFIDDPRATLRKVQDLAGLPAASESLEFLGDGWVNLTVPHTVSGNPMRFTAGRIALRRDEDWRSAFPARQRRAVTALTLPVSGLMGYWRHSSGGSR
jgi:hypothetical protein